MAHGKSAGHPASVPQIRSRGARLAGTPAGDAAILTFARPDLAGGQYRVLLAHDLTGPSEIALVRAARLALERNGHLTILHVVDNKLPVPVIEERRARAKNLLASEAGRWLEQSKLPYRVDIGVGAPADAIAARAQAHDVDLVMTGRHRRRALAGMFSATTAEHLLQRIARPILVVSSPNQSPYRRVLIPIDFTSASAARIRLAAAFLPQANLHLLHACRRGLYDYVAPLSLGSCAAMQAPFSGPTRQQPEHAISCFIETLGLGESRPMVTSENGDALALLKAELARQKLDLLVLGGCTRCGAAHGPIGSATQSVLRASRCDVLLLPSAGAISPA